MSEEKSKHTEEPKMRIGFVGIGSSVTGIILQNLLKTGYTFTVWAETFKELIQDNDFKCFKYASENLEILPESEEELLVKQSVIGVFEDCTNNVCRSFNIVPNPAEVVEDSDIIFSFFLEQEVLKEVWESDHGLLRPLYTSKGYVEMTTIDAATSSAMDKAIAELGGKYLELSCMPSINLLKEKKVVLFSAGCKELNEKCLPFFRSIAEPEHTFYYGSEVGHAANMNLLHQFCMSSNVVALSEILGLCEATGIDQALLVKLFETDFALPPVILEKAYAMLEKKYTLDTSVESARNSLAFLTDTLYAANSPSEVARVTFQALMLAHKRGHGFDDISAVHSNHSSIE